MKTIKPALMSKIIENGGILDTRAYRYRAIDADTAERMPIEYVGTTAVFGYEWEKVYVKN